MKKLQKRLALKIDTIAILGNLEGVRGAALPTTITSGTNTTITHTCECPPKEIG